MVGIYALGALGAVILLVILTQTMRRKSVLTAALAGFPLFNLVTALSGSIVLTIVARFMAGVSAGLVTDPLKGRALAVAMVGAPIALSVGLPLGTFAGSLIGSRRAFLAVSGVAAVLLGVIAGPMPDVPGQWLEHHVTLSGVLAQRGVRALPRAMLTPGIAAAAHCHGFRPGRRADVKPSSPSH